MAGQLVKEGAAFFGLCHFARTKARAFAGHAAHFNTLAIGGVEQHDAAAFDRRHALQSIAAAKADDASYTGALRIALCKIDHAVRHIAAVNQGRVARLGVDDARFRFLADGLPHMGLKGQVFLKRKLAQQAGWNIAGDLRRFNRHRAAAAAGVVQGPQISVAIGPAAGRNHGGGQGFFEGRIARVFAPAAFEQGFTGGVDIQGTLVGGQVRKDAHIGPAGIDIRAHAVDFVAKAVADRIFDFESRKVQRGQRTVLRRHLHFDALLGREPNFPGHRSGGAVQVLFAAVVRQGQLHHHPLR